MNWLILQIYYFSMIFICERMHTPNHIIKEQSQKRFSFFPRNYCRWSSKLYSFQFYASKRKHLNCLIVVIKRLLSNMSTFRKTKKEKSVWKKMFKANNGSVSSEKIKRQRFVVTRSSCFRSGEQTKFFSKRCRHIGQKLRFKRSPESCESQKIGKVWSREKT